MTGTDLKLKRVAAHLKAKDVAVEMGISPWTVSRLERDAFVPIERAAAYVAAVATLSAKNTAAA